jgi:hypothetical protein
MGRVILTTSEVMVGAVDTLHQDVRQTDRPQDQAQADHHRYP